MYLGKIYHDFPNEKEMGPLNIDAVNRAIFRALKPGGAYIIVEHAAHLAQVISIRNQTCQNDCIASIQKSSKNRCSQSGLCWKPKARCWRIPMIHIHKVSSIHPSERERIGLYSSSGSQSEFRSTWAYCPSTCMPSVCSRAGSLDTANNV